MNDHQANHSGSREELQTDDGRAGPLAAATPGGRVQTHASDHTSFPMRGREAGRVNFVQNNYRGSSQKTTYVDETGNDEGDEKRCNDMI